MLFNSNFWKFCLIQDFWKLKILKIQDTENSYLVRDFEKLFNNVDFRICLIIMILKIVIRLKMLKNVV